MAAYAAVVSLSNTIHRLMNHNRLSISVADNKQLLSLLHYVTSFEAFLEKYPDEYKSLEGRMAELAHEAEDIIQYFMSEQVSSWPNYTEEVMRRLKWIDLPTHNNTMVGFEDYAMDLKDRLRGESSKLQVITICGMAGSGKTNLARNVYHDPSIVDHFLIRVWVTISQYSSVQRTISSLLECLKEFNTGGLGQSDEEKVYQILRGRRYLVVMDSIWSSKAWDAVRKVFPNDGNGSRVMLTTRLCDVASYPDHSSKLYQMGLLNADQSWNLLKQKVFGDEECPSELENIAKDIARRCKGWPLALVKIAGVLSKSTRNCVSWKVWAEHTSQYLEKDCLSSCNLSGCHQHELHPEKVVEHIGSIAEEVREIKDSSSSSSNDVQRGADSSAALSSSSTSLPIHKDVMVGFEDYVIGLKDRLCGERSKKLQVIPICGMGGIGKTTLARNVYGDPLITSHFDIRVWLTISQDFSAQRIHSSLLESLKEYNTGRLGQSDEEKVYKILKWRRYLVVMDDIWSSEAWDVVRRVFPDDGNGSRVMLTTRLSDVTSYPDPSSKLYEMSLLNEFESWNLLKQNVFGGEDCPFELQDIGKQIARSCKGLPLAIVVIAGLLSTVSKNPTSWLEIAENVKSAETAEHNQIEEILSLSYVQLPQYLRPCFLYMASFPEDHEIHVKKLIRLWVAEGFVKSPIYSDNFENVAEECLEELVKRNIVLVTKRKWDGRIKRCSLHDLMRELCIRKSHESKFFLNLMDRYIGKECFIEKVRNQRRVSVDSSKLEFFSSLNGSTIRSIKCSQYCSAERLDFLENVRLLRVLDAEPLSVRHLPTLGYLDELFNLRYLSIRSRGDIPTSLPVLQNLQTLIIHQNFQLGALETPMIVLTWCMSQLRHVYYGGTIHFDDPEETDCPLESLQTLSRVTLYTCREAVLKMIPNLKKLQIDCSEGVRYDSGVCLDDLVHLHLLETLEIYEGRCVPKYYKISFPRMLKKLILRRFSLPWSDIFVLSSLPNLQVLNLFGCACVGGTWETTEGAFPMLEVLEISNSSLENWVTESSHFPRLKLLLLHDCEDLNEIPCDIGDIPTLQLIEVRGSVKKSLIDSVELIREEQEEMGNNTLQVVCTAKPTNSDDAPSS